jgi:hypothetical protein
VDAYFGNRLCRTQRSDKRFDGDDSVVSAPIAPAEHIDVFILEITQRCRALRPFFPCKRTALHAAHCSSSKYSIASF